MLRLLIDKDRIQKPVVLVVPVLRLAGLCATYRADDKNAGAGTLGYPSAASGT